jgi:hypothetical protein
VGTCGRDRIPDLRIAGSWHSVDRELPRANLSIIGLTDPVAIWQDLVDTCGFASGYQSVRRFVSKLHPNQSSEACAVIETAPRLVFNSSSQICAELHEKAFRRLGGVARVKRAGPTRASTAPPSGRSR